jgi:hypothetical protein
MISGDRQTAQKAGEDVDDLARNRREHKLPYNRITIENARTKCGSSSWRPFVLNPAGSFEYG